MTITTYQDYILWWKSCFPVIFNNLIHLLRPTRWNWQFLVQSLQHLKSLCEIRLTVVGQKHDHSFISLSTMMFISVGHLSLSLPPSSCSLVGSFHPSLILLNFSLQNMSLEGTRHLKKKEKKKERGKKPSSPQLCFYSRVALGFVLESQSGFLQ